MDYLMTVPFSAVGALLLAILTVPATAQNTLFMETFAAGIPPDWSSRMLGVPIDPWSAGISPATNSADVFHEWFCNHGGLTRDNMLVTSRIDLGGFGRIDFACVQHQLFPTQRGRNRVEVSVDGGQTFATLYEEFGTWSGVGAIHANLDAYAGQADVRIAFHYEGAIANEWRIDDVQVTTPDPVLDIQGLVAGGTASLAVVGASPGALVLTGISLLGAGPLSTPFGNLSLTPPIFILSLQNAGSNGSSATPLAIPVWASGITLHAQAAALRLDGTVQLSNWRTGTTQ